MKSAEKTVLTHLDEPGDPPSRIDPELNDSLAHPGMDPAGQDFRDTLEVTDALDSVGVVQGIDAELKEQHRQVEEDTLEVLEAMRSLDHGGTVKWRITRIGTGNPELDGFLDTWPTKLLTLERIRDKMGGGTYYLKGFRNGKYWVHKTVEIAGVPKVYSKDGDGAGNNMTAQPSHGFDIQGFLAQQEARDGQRRREAEAARQQEKAERLEAEERADKRRQDLLAIVMPVVGAAVTGITAAFAGPRASPMADIAALMAAMKGPDPITVLTQLKALERGGSQDTLGRVLPMLIDMASDRATGGDTGWMDVVKELVKSAGPTVGAMIEHSVQQAQARGAEASGMGPGVSGNIPLPVLEHQAPASPALPGPQPPLIMVPESVSRRERRPRSVSDGLPAGSVGSGAGMGGRSVNTVGASSKGAEMNFLALLPHRSWLLEQLQRCRQAAMKGRDPEVYAAMFVEELPEGVEPQMIVQLLSRDDWYGLLVQLDNSLNDQNLVPWFSRMMQGVLISMQHEAGVTAPQPESASAQPTAPAQPVARRLMQGEARPTKIPSLTGED